MVARVRLLMSSFRVCAAVVALYVLLALDVVLPTRVAEATLSLLLVVLSVRSWGFVLAAVLDHAFLTRSERLAILAERSEVGGSKSRQGFGRGVCTARGSVCLRGNVGSGLGFR